MKTYKLPVTWEAYGEIEIEAENDIDFLAKVKRYRIIDADLSLPKESEYIDDSFRIDEDELIKEMNEITVNDIDEAKSYVKFVLSMHKEYPFDEWIQISDKHELNLWIEDDTNEKKASLFPVINGETDTSVWTEIDVGELEVLKLKNDLTKIVDIKGPLLIKKRYKNKVDYSEPSVRKIIEFYYRMNSISNYVLMADKYIKNHNITISEVKQ